MRGLPARDERHARDHGRGVEAARQEGCHRDVAHEVGRDRVVEPLEHPPLDVGRHKRGVLGQVPVPVQRNLAGVAPQEPVAGLQLAHVAERCRRRQDVTELEVAVQGVPVEFAHREARGD